MSEKQPPREISGIARPVTPDERRPVDVSALTRYDLLLAAIPIVLLAAWIAGQVVTAPVWVALGIGALVVVPALVDGLLLNPPS